MVAPIQPSDKRRLAAMRLESLTIIARQVILNLRAGHPDHYAQVYWLRKEMTKIVASLGAGTPMSIVMKHVQQELEPEGEE